MNMPRWPKSSAAAWTSDLFQVEQIASRRL